MYQRFLGGTFNKGDFALWDIVSKKSESWFLAGDTTYIKKVFQVSDTLFKILEQKPFEVATIRDSTLNVKPKPINLFGRFDYRIRQASNVNYYISPEDSIFYQNGGQLEPILRSTYTYNTDNYFTLNDTLYLFEFGSKWGREPDSISISLHSISSVSTKVTEFKFAKKNYGITSVSRQFVAPHIFDKEKVFFLVGFNNGSGHAAKKAYIELDLKTFQIQMINKGFGYHRVVGSKYSKEELFIYQTDFTESGRSLSLQKLNLQTKQTKKIISDDLVLAIGGVDAVHPMFLSATLQLKSPSKAIDFTRPVSFDNRLGENEQLSFI